MTSTDSGQNPGNSWNSRGIKFGREACEIDQMIPTEVRMEFEIPLEWFLESPRRNEFPEFNRMESHNTYNAQPCPNRSSVFADDQFGCGQRCQTLLSLTTTIIHNAHPTSPPHYHHQRPPPPPMVTSCPQ